MEVFDTKKKLAKENFIALGKMFAAWALFMIGLTIPVKLVFIACKFLWYLI